jgi:hypothetical protein
MSGRQKYMPYEAGIYAQDQDLKQSGSRHPSVGKENGERGSLASQQQKACAQDKNPDEMLFALHLLYPNQACMVLLSIRAMDRAIRKATPPIMTSSRVYGASMASRN